eukprot:TRINITY_DN22757_c0_g1_i1.p1 TRINITY_DN22757_c0_g1~~TRINITY_DN22757_c0_g1_i1.p1  ORF type:complete len:233 (+),score=40.67 TRINITY_DN22757_c0_g1_i1:45-701(+)
MLAQGELGVPGLAELAQALFNGEGELSQAAPARNLRSSSSSSKQPEPGSRALQGRSPDLASAASFQDFFRPGTWQRRPAAGANQPGAGPPNLRELLEVAAEVAAGPSAASPPCRRAKGKPAAAASQAKSRRCACGQRHWRKMSCRDNVVRQNEGFKHQVYLGKLQLARKNQELHAARSALERCQQVTVPGEIQDFLARHPNVESLKTLEDALRSRQGG